MDLESVRFVFAAYAGAFLVLVVWTAMIARKVARLTTQLRERERSQ